MNPIQRSSNGPKAIKETLSPDDLLSLASSETSDVLFTENYLLYGSRLRDSIRSRLWDLAGRETVLTMPACLSERALSETVADYYFFVLKG